MSNHWSVHCVDCNDDHGNPRNHAEDGMVALIAHREVWELVGERAPDVSELSYDGRVLSGYRVIPFWFLKHRGHVLAPQSEYGYLLDDCTKQFTCGECNTVHTCRRKKDHTGGHSRIRGYTPGPRL